MSQSSLVIAQIVQHLAPGGIETMVLDLQSQASDAEQVYIISLEGDYAEAVSHWPRIEKYSKTSFSWQRTRIETRSYF